MGTVSLNQEYPQSTATIWAVIGDPAGVEKWIPAIESSRIDGDVRHVVFTDGNPARERIVSHDDEKRTYTYEYIDGPLPLAKYVSTIRVEDTAAGSVVRWDAQFTAAGDDPAAVEAQLETGIGDIYQSALDEISRLTDQ